MPSNPKSTIAPDYDPHSKARLLLCDNDYFSTLWTDDLELIDANKSMLELFDMGKERFLNSFFELFPIFQPNGKNSAQTAMEHLKSTLELGFTSFEWTFLTKQGNMFSVQTALVRHTVNEKYYIISHSSKITNQKQTFQSVDQSYERGQITLKHLPIGVDFWNDKFELIDCNEGSLKLFGLASKQEYFDNFHTFSPEFQPNGQRSADLIPKYLTKALEDGVVKFEWMHINQSGEELPVEATLVCNENKGEKNIIVYYRDLREIKQGIKNTNRLKRRLVHILNAAPYSITLWDKDAKPIDCNNATLHFFGFDTKKDFFEKHYYALPTFQRTGIMDEGPFYDLFKQVFSDGYAYYEGEIGNFKNNDLYFVEVILRRVVIDDEVFAVSYLNDLTYQKAMLNEIVESHRAVTIARDTAEKSTKIKSEFLANMSHEIRTPMNGILGLIHLLGFTSLQDQQKEYVDKIRYSAESLLRIINDILDFSKIEAGKLEIENTSFTLGEVKEDLYALFAPKFAEKNIIGQIFNQDVEHVRLIGDPLRLKQVLLNLIGNAIKFTDAGSVITKVNLDINKDNNTVFCAFSVTDTGIGLSKEHCKRLFSAFSQADASTTRKYGGTGLGLVISKRIVEIMDGDIWVESEPGKGSKFYFTANFKLDTSDLPELDYFANLDQINKVPTMQSGTSLDVDNTPSLYGYILLVEDNEINQLIANELLSIKGHKIDIANNGQEAIDMINQNNYDLILMDIQMPIMDGLTATKILRSMPKHENLPIIAMSAHAMKGDREISLSHGMNDHLSKPINPNELYDCLNSWLSKKLHS